MLMLIKACACPPFSSCELTPCIVSVQHGNGHPLQGWCRAGKLAAAGLAGLVLCNPPPRHRNCIYMC
jgi:hypothetical protein